VRVKIKNKIGRSSIESVAVANAGYEIPEPEVTLPLKAAQKLGLWPNFPEGSRMEEYRTAGGVVKLLRTPPCISIELKNRKSTCRAVLSHVENEIILSDKVCDELAIILEEPGRGRWRIRGERVKRESEEPEYWE
jgi:hypothetical protein